MPPGQFVTEKFPVFTYGSSPQIDLKEWEFEIFGLVEETLRFTYEQLMQLPKVKVVADFHCVTQWSRLLAISVVNQQKWDRSGPEKIIVMKS